MCDMALRDLPMQWTAWSLLDLDPWRGPSDGTVCLAWGLVPAARAPSISEVARQRSAGPPRVAWAGSPRSLEFRGFWQFCGSRCRSVDLSGARSGEIPEVLVSYS